MRLVQLAIAALVASAAPALAQGTPAQQGATAALKPAVVYDLGGKFDKSFNEASYNGAEKFKKETGIDYREFEIQNDAAARAGAAPLRRATATRPIVAVGFSQAGGARRRSPTEFPNTKFAIIDAVVDKPNVRSIVFKEHEGSFLVGMLAAMASKTGKVGFVGGMDIPLIRKFACGYVQGVKCGQAGRRGLPEHDRHDRRGLERPGQGRRARQEPDRPAAPTSSTPPPAAPASACCRRPPTPASSASASIPTRTACTPARC